MCSMSRSAVSTAVMFCGNVIRYANPVKRSKTTKISSFLLLLRKAPAKSIAMEEKGSLETVTGVTSTSGRVVGYVLIWQRRHPLI